jgi:predicted anti-sigma-YlaC factor YlaD
MNCEEIRRILRQRFDDGDDLAHGLKSHLEDCASCREYAERLHAMNGALMHLPLEEPAANLADRVRARVMESPREFPRPIAAALAAMLIVVSGVMGWFDPIAVNPAYVSAKARIWMTYMDPREAGAFMVSQASGLWEQSALQAGRYAAGIPPLLLWLTLGAMLLVLLAFNGFEAARVRCTGFSLRFRAHSGHHVTNEKGH